jgi:flagellar biosynthesis GTPase FlhF
MKTNFTSALKRKFFSTKKRILLLLIFGLLIVNLTLIGGLAEPVQQSKALAHNSESTQLASENEALKAEKQALEEKIQQEEHSKKEAEKKLEEERAIENEKAEKSKELEKIQFEAQEKVRLEAEQLAKQQEEAQKLSVEQEKVTQSKIKSSVTEKQSVQATTPKQSADLSRNTLNTNTKKPITANPVGYVEGTCKELREKGVGRGFRPGDPNYTPKRDRDNDGIACE